MSNEAQALCSRFCLLEAPMSSGSTLSWRRMEWHHHGWSDHPSPEPAASEPASDERVTNALHRVQDLLQQTTVLSPKKTPTERAVTISKGNAAHAAMEAATRARVWQDEAKRLRDQNFKKPLSLRPSTTRPYSARSSRRKNRGSASGLTGDCRGGLLPDTPRATGGDTARRQRALRTALPDPHHTLSNAHRSTMSHAALCPQLCNSNVRVPAATSSDTDEEELRQNILNALLGIFMSFQPGDRLEAYLTGRRNQPAMSRTPCGFGAPGLRAPEKVGTFLSLKVCHHDHHPNDSEKGLID